MSAVTTGLRKMSLKFCANLTFLFNETESIVERYRLAKAAGFKGVESAFPNVSLEELVAVQQETGLEQVLLNIDTGTVSNGAFGCASFVNSTDDFKKNLTNTLRYAKALNCKKIHIMAGKHSEPIDEKNDAFYLANLRYAANILNEEGIMGVIEPINKYAVPGYYLSSYEKAIQMLQSVNNHSLKLMVDLYHLQHIKGNITYSLKEFESYIGHVQIAQTPFRHEPDIDGEVNLKYVLKTLEQYGYNDWVGCEYRPINGTVAGLKWIKDFGYEL